MSSGADQVSVLEEIKKMLKDLSEKSGQQQLAGTSLSEKFESFEEHCNSQFATLAASCSESRLAHNAYADRVDTITAWTLRAGGPRGRLDFHDSNASETHDPCAVAPGHILPTLLPLGSQGELGGGSQ